MRSTITGIQMGIRAAWLVQLVLGVLFWTGNRAQLVVFAYKSGLVRPGWLA